MRRLLPIMFVSLVLSGCGTSTVPVDDEFVKSALSRNMTPSAQGIEDLTAGNMDFGFDLFAQLVDANDGKNVFLSPHSVSIALSMAWAGAKGETASQMADVLAFSGMTDTALETFNALDLELSKRGTEELEQDQGGDPFELSIVNQAWGRIGFDFLSEYLDALALNFGAGMRLLDFSGDSDGSRVIINDWVASETHDRIQDLLPEGSISAATALVLTNVIYFKASWLDKFDPSNTTDASFKKLDSSTVDVKMMQKYDELLHGAGANYEYLEIPYVGENVAMALILPDTGMYAQVEAGLDGATFRQMMADAQPAAGTVRLPRFTFEFESSLNDALIALGMVNAFVGGSADFSGIDGRPGNLFISLVQHKSFVAVDEEGTEAAAATAVVMDESAGPVDTFDMTFDRPFIFVIIDKPTGAVLFLGRVLDPGV